MKKNLVLFFTIAILLISGTIIFASAEDFSLFIDYNQNVFKGVPVKTDVKLVGNNAPAHSNVRVKVDISGPATPTLMATDSEGQEWDIAQIGYWGPETGFAVGGTFTNTTPVTATFPEAGLYEITISLVDVEQPATTRASTDNVIASSKESIYVYRDQAELDAILNSKKEENNTTNIVENTTGDAVENLPKTGTSFAEYAIYLGCIAVICLVGYAIIRNYRIKL